MATNRQIRELLDATAYDVDGDKLGNVKEVYINDTTGQPDFVEVNHGLFGMNSSLVPLRGHSLSGEDLRLAFNKDRIKDAPDLEGDAHLSTDEQQSLYAHYGLDATEDVTTYEPDHGDRAGLTDQPRTAGVGGGADQDVVDVNRPNTGAGFGTGAGLEADAERAAEADRLADADRNRAVGTETDGVVRSEERLNVDKDRVNTGEARLRKYVVHDTETVEVPVEREEVHVERTPLNADDAAAVRDAELGEDEASVTLSEERVNVSKETVPVEKVSLEKDTVRDTETVSEDVAKERVETDLTDDEAARRRDRR